MSQADRILAALARAGTHGITRVDFTRYPTLDGGPPILNLPARILELKQAGFNIVDDGRRDKCTVYVLDLTSTGQLFALDPPTFDQLCPTRKDAA